jgi:hypothetical protein
MPTRGQRLRTLVAVVALTMALTPVAPAQAGTYVINNCPSAPTANGDPGPWVVFGSPQLSKGSCSGGEGDWIGPRGGSMSAGSADGVRVTVPSGSGMTIREAKVWWSVPHQISGADTFAVAYANGAGVGESTTPAGSQANPDVFVLPSTTTTFTLEDYCSNDDAGQGCVFGGGENPNLELYGAQLTLADSRPPSGKVTGGGLESTGALSGSQSLGYSAEDGDSGVRLVRLLIDGAPVASNDYIANCPYTNFLACPASESDSLRWNTASVADGEHTLELSVQDAAQNTSIIYTGSITTANAPSNSSPPSITTAGRPLTGSTLSAQPGEWSAPTGAGAVTYGLQWQDCDSDGNNCNSIPGAQGASYTPAARDAGHTLRVLVSAADSDGSTSLTTTASAVVAAPQALTQFPTEPTITANGATGPAAGVPNGTGASDSATLQLAGRSVISRSFAQRALTLTGRLTNSTGSPISGATLEILEKIAGTSSSRVIAHATTHFDGSYVAHVPAGPSRSILLAYRAFASEANYAAEATLQESVGAGVQLHVTPRHTSPSGTIRLIGQVQGPIPSQGVIVELLVHYLGHWEPFRTPRTDAGGRFHVSYQFQGAIGRFPFRAEAPSGQSGFPFTVGYSGPVDVSTN